MKKPKKKNRAFLSSYFVDKAGGYYKLLDLGEKHGLWESTIRGWVTQYNSAPLDHPALLKIAKEIGCPEKRIFEGQ